MRRVVFSAVFALLALVSGAQTVSLAASADTTAAPADTLPGAPADSVAYVPRVSLLTCSPGVEVWQQYGHTAIRFEDAERDIDVVFNYGLFDFDAPHFIWRFCLGQTDYIVGAEPYDSFKKEYVERGSSVTQQTLALTAREATRFWELIILNCRPENRTYRYDFLYRNCSTMARDILYKAMDSPAGIARTDSVSFRTILHRHNAAYPWASFGIDLLLGAEADRPVGHDLQEFAPQVLEESFSLARRSGEPLVADVAVTAPTAPLPTPFRFPLTPLQAMILVLLLTAIVCTFELLTQTRVWWYDILLYGLQGVAGIIITFLFFFSTHPTVGSNVLAVLFNPIVFVLLPFILRQARLRRRPWAAWTEVALIVLLGLVWLIVRQDIPLAAWVFVAALLLRSVHHLLGRIIKKSK